MSHQERSEHVDNVRRKLLKSSMVAGGFLAAGHLPYSRPAVRSFFGTRSAWAQQTTILSVQFSDNLPDLGGGLGTGQDAWELTTTQPNTTLTINVIITAGAAAPEIGLFAPGVLTTGTNLLIGGMGGYTGPYPVVILAAAAGTHTLAIEDINIDANETPFAYTLDVSADMPIVPGAKVISSGPETLEPASGSG